MGAALEEAALVEQAVQVAPERRRAVGVDLGWRQDLHQPRALVEPGGAPAAQHYPAGHGQQ